jgi:serine/threonine protein kinase
MQKVKRCWKLAFVSLGICETLDASDRQRRPSSLAPLDHITPIQRIRHVIAQPFCPSPSSHRRSSLFCSSAFSRSGPHMDFAKEHRARLGARIDGGRLEFVNVLGLGAYGVVYLARDRRHASSRLSPDDPYAGHGPLFAVKCLNTAGLDARQRLFQHREINLHARTSVHPNVVSLVHVVAEPDCLYVILDFCPDGDLFGMITERHRYLADDALVSHVFLQLLDAVKFCHDAGVYHRDLKPENILCCKDGTEVLLADFGLATEEQVSSDFGCGVSLPFFFYSANTGVLTSCGNFPGPMPSHPFTCRPSAKGDPLRRHPGPTLHLGMTSGASVSDRVSDRSSIRFLPLSSPHAVKLGWAYVTHVLERARAHMHAVSSAEILEFTGVILVNLTCGRNPWKQATHDDPTFARHLVDPRFLSEILPISPACHRLLARIFCLDPRKRIGLEELREEVKKITKWTLSEEELRRHQDAVDASAAASSPADVDIDPVSYPPSFRQPSPRIVQPPRPAIVNEAPPWEGVPASADEVPFVYQQSSSSTPDNGLQPSPFAFSSATAATTTKRRGHCPPPVNIAPLPQRRLRHSPASVAQSRPQQRRPPSLVMRGEDDEDLEDSDVEDDHRVLDSRTPLPDESATLVNGFLTPPATPNRSTFHGRHYPTRGLESAFSDFSECDSASSTAPRQQQQPGKTMYTGHQPVLPPTPNMSPRRWPPPTTPPNIVLPPPSPPPSISSSRNARRLLGGGSLHNRSGSLPITLRSRSASSSNLFDANSNEPPADTNYFIAASPPPPAARNCPRRLPSAPRRPPPPPPLPPTLSSFAELSQSSSSGDGSQRSSSSTTHSGSGSASSSESAFGPPTPRFAACRLDHPSVVATAHRDYAFGHKVLRSLRQRKVSRTMAMEDPVEERFGGVVDGLEQRMSG